MKITDFEPADILKPFIKAYKIIETDRERINKILPGTSVTLAFRLKGHTTYSSTPGQLTIPAVVLSGLRRSVRDIHYAPGTATLVVLFQEGGAPAFLRDPIHQLYEQSIALDDIITLTEVNRVQELIWQSKTHAEQVAVVEHFLMCRLHPRNIDLLVSAAVTKIKSVNGVLRIKELADELCISTDAFEKRFRKVTGATPKQFASIVRLSSVVHRKSNERFLDIAFDAGYYDQAHFTRDFKIFTGQTPSDFYQSPAFW